MTSHKVTLWAWGISLVAHALVIGIVILLSSRNEPGLEQPAQATQIRLEQPLPTEPPPTVIENLMVENPLILPLIPPAPPVLNPIAVADTPLSTSAGEGFTIAAAPVTGELTTGTTAAVFCGTPSQGRYLCYIVDCSGSMVMALDYVQSELCRSLEALTPSQFFRLILFAGGTPSIWPAEGYRRANAPARCQAVTFVKTLQLKETPGVQAASDAVVQAIDAALTITASNDTPDTIFLLTDGEFEHQAVAQQLFRLQAQRSTPATLHVIACGNPDNEQFLRRLAQSYQGSYRFISDDELARAGRHLSQGESR